MPGIISLPVFTGRVFFCLKKVTAHSFSGMKLSFVELARKKMCFVPGMTVISNSKSKEKKEKC